MTRRGILFWLTIFFGSFFVGNFLYAADPSIVITEIGAYEPSGQEWIEIYNRSDQDVL